MTEINQQEEQVEELQVAEPTEQVAEEVSTEPEKKDSGHHWNEVHKVLKQQKNEIEELRRMNMQLQEFQQRQSVREEPDEFDQLDPEELISVEKAKKLVEKKAGRAAKEEAQKLFQEYAHQQAMIQDESRMRSKYDDYDYVIQTFAIPQFQKDPALAYKIQMSKNPAEAAYKLGKLSDEYEDSRSETPTSQKTQKILKNSQRPMSASGVGTSSLKSQADNFSNLSRDDVWAMSQKFARGG